MWINRFCIIYILFNIGIISAQENSHFFGLDEGLPNSIVNDINQDQQGFIWVSTMNGLLKYDGYKPVVFKPENTNGLLSDQVYDLCVAKDSLFYIGHKKGVVVYKPELEEFTTINELYPEIDNIGEVRNISQDEGGDIWFVDEKSNVLYNILLEKKTIMSYQLPLNAELNEGHIFTIQVINSKYVFLGGNKGFGLYNMSTGQFSFLLNEKINDFELMSDVYILAKHNGISAIQLDSGSVSIIPFDEINKEIGEANVLFKKSPTELYIGAAKGIFLYNTNSKKLIPQINFQSNDNIKTVSALFADNSETLWYGNMSQGICYKTKKDKEFETIIPEPNKSANIGGILIDRDIVYIGTWDGDVLKYSIPDKKFAEFNFPETFDNPKSVVAIEQDINGRIWFGGAGGNPLIVFNPEKNIVQGFRPSNDIPSAISGWSTRDIEIDRDGDVWIGTIDGGVNMYDIDKNIFINKNNNDSIKKISSDGIWKIYVDKENMIWIGSQEGLFSIEKESWKTDAVWITENNEIRDIFKDDKGQLWLGTDQGLFNRLESGQFIHISQRDNLPVETIYGILQDDNNQLWLSTESGLFSYNMKTQRSLHYDKTDGLSSNEFNFCSSYKDTDGKMYFGSVNGITCFYPDNIHVNDIIPEVYITKLFIDNKEVKPGEKINSHYTHKQSILFTDKIILSHIEKAIGFEFVALNFQNPDKCKYAYQLTRKNEEKDNWIEVGADKRFANYLNLPPGEYVFKVIASNNDDVWNTIGTSLNITVLPPWWKTIWFRFTIIVILISVFFVGFRLRVRTMKERQKQLEKLVEERTFEVEQQKQVLEIQAENLKETNVLLKERQEEIELQADELLKLNETKDKLFSIIAHDLKNPFMGIIGFSEILLNKNKKIEPEKRDQFVSMILESSKSAHNLLDNLLKWARTQIGAMEKQVEDINVMDVIEDNISMLKVNALKKNIEIFNRIEDNYHIRADKNMITTVIRNILNNAIKFTPEFGTIEFSGKNSGGYFYLHIKDTGVGMNKTMVQKLFHFNENITTKGTSGETGTGLGLIICYDFMKINNGEIMVNSVEGNGTTFTLKIPFSSDSQKVKENKETKYDSKVNLQLDIPDDELIKQIDKEKTELFIGANGATILLIDDEEQIRETIKESFQGTYSFFEAINGKQGWEIAVEKMPDVIISDVMMPEMEGTELCELIKKDERTSHIPVVLLTAKGSEFSQIKGLGTGADDYIVKPFNSRILEAKINSIIENRYRLRSKFVKDITLSPKEITTNPIDKAFLEKAIKIIEENISEIEFDVTRFTREIALSRTQLHKKLKALTGKSTTEFVRSIRLKKASELIKQNYPISDIYILVGFNTRSYFYKCFTEQFGISPGKFKNNKQ